MEYDPTADNSDESSYDPTANNSDESSSVESWDDNNNIETVSSSSLEFDPTPVNANDASSMEDDESFNEDDLMQTMEYNPTADDESDSGDSNVPSLPVNKRARHN
jgi:hypothetical protein